MVLIGQRIISLLLKVYPEYTDLKENANDMQYIWL